MRIEIVSATRHSRTDYFRLSPLAYSLRRFGRDTRISASVTCDNTLGLSTIYNRRILSDDDVDALVFVHDDVWLEDSFFGNRVAEALERYDVFGIAGCRSLGPRQPPWCFVNDTYTPQPADNLAGWVGHGKLPLGEISIFGDVPASCELVDGLLIGARKSMLRAHGILFDERFDFHFYDVDFCRSIRKAGLTLGAWPISITHQSAGNFKSPGWRRNLALYREKWPD